MPFDDPKRAIPFYSIPELLEACEASEVHSPIAYKGETMPENTQYFGEFLKKIDTYPAHEISDLVKLNGKLNCDACFTEILESEIVFDVNGSWYTHRSMECLNDLLRQEASLKS